MGGAGANHIALATPTRCGTAMGRAMLQRRLPTKSKTPMRWPVPAVAAIRIARIRRLQPLGQGWQRDVHVRASALMGPCKIPRPVPDLSLRCSQSRYRRSVAEPLGIPKIIYRSGHSCCRRSRKRVATELDHIHHFVVFACATVWRNGGTVRE